ncbi:MAG: hypothetical protein ACKOED_09365 [Aestuariivirga sp.]|uniref:hypothetical protein n=1 Tax=Aestuariivirga sp. TaxID=2650926 RepID=UPI0038D0B562
MTAFAVRTPAETARSRIAISDDASGLWREAVIVHPRNAGLERFEFSLNHHLKLGVTPAKAGVQL